MCSPICGIHFKLHRRKFKFLRLDTRPTSSISLLTRGENVYDARSALPWTVHWVLRISYNSTPLHHISYHPLPEVLVSLSHDISLSHWDEMALAGTSHNIPFRCLGPTPFCCMKPMISAICRRPYDHYALAPCHALLIYVALLSLMVRSRPACCWSGSMLGFGPSN